MTLRRTRIRRRTRTKHQERNAQHRDYVAWVHTQPCASCGMTASPHPTLNHIQAAHVGRGGMGMKHGSDAEVIPLCGPMSYGLFTTMGCHAEHDQRDGRFSSKAMTKDALREWNAEQVRIHRARWQIFTESQALREQGI